MLTVGFPSVRHHALLIVAAVASVALARQARRASATDRVRTLRDAPSRMPSAIRARLEPALLAADVAIEPAAAIQVWVMAALAAACVAAGFDRVFVPAAAGLVLAAGPIWLFAARDRGRRRLTAELPGALESVASELRTGGTVAGALDAIGQTGGPLAAEFARLTRRRALGAPLERALEAWAAERPEPVVTSAAGALAVAASTGGRAAAALDGLASSLRDRAEIRAESRALSAQARLSALVVGCLPVAYLALSTLLDRRTVGLVTGTGFGRICLAVALGLETLAAFWIRALLREES